MKSLLIICLISLLMVFPAYAQEGSVNIQNDTDEALDADPILEAAQPLVDRGAAVAIYFVQAGESDTFTELLQDDNLMVGNSIGTDVISIFVSLDDRHMELLYGDQWLPILDPRSEGILSGSLGPNLREGNYTLAFVRTLEEIERLFQSTIGSGAPDPNTTYSYPTPSTTYPAYDYEPTPDDGGGFPGGLVFMLLLFAGGYGLTWLLRQMGLDVNTGNTGGRPYYRSPWTSNRSSGGSYRPSSRSSGSGRSFGGGGRRSGKW